VKAILLTILILFSITGNAKPHKLKVSPKVTGEQKQLMINTFIDGCIAGVSGMISYYEKVPSDRVNIRMVIGKCTQVSKKYFHYMEKHVL